MQPMKIPGLDGLRAVAFLLVFAFHTDFLQAGWIGVQFFFVLSGFLITLMIILSYRPNYMKIFLNQVGDAVLCIGTLLLAALSYRLLEKPLLDLKDRLFALRQDPV